MHTKRDRHARHAAGFTLIELLIVLAIVALIVAVAVPNAIAAIDHGKHTTTMANIRQIGRALEAYAIDHNGYPKVATIEDLAAVLEPTFLREVPRSDGWGNPLTYECADDGQDFTIVSPGKNGKPDVLGLAARSADEDIVFASGRFAGEPESERS